MSGRYPSRQQVANALVEALGVRRIPATIVDYDPDRPGNVIVEQQSADGRAFRRSVAMKATIPVTPGLGVLLGKDHLRRMVVKEADFDQITATGGNPHATNAADRNFYAPTSVETIHALACVAVSTDTVTSMEVAVFPWMWRAPDGTWYEFPEQRFDFTDPDGDGSEPTLVPSANQHRLVALWVSDTNEIRWTASTAQSQLDSIDISDVQECEDSAELTWTPIKFWRLYGGMTTVRESDSWRTGVQIINVGAGGTGSGGGGSSNYPPPIDLGNTDYTVATNTQVIVNRFEFSGTGDLILQGTGEVHFA